MGYHANVSPEVKIPVKFEQAAFRAFKSYLLKRYHESNHDEINALGDLVECFEHLQYKCVRKKNHFVIDSYGDDEAGHVDKLWGILAKFMETGSHIIVSSETDPEDRVKLTVSKGKLVEIQGRWIWEDEIADLKKIH